MDAAFSDFTAAALDCSTACIRSPALVSAKDASSLAFVTFFLNSKYASDILSNLSNAEEIKGGSGCPFYNPLYLTRKDGNVGVIYPATDSCSAFRTENGNYYDYTPGYEDNSEFWSYFEGWLEGMYPDTYGRIAENLLSPVYLFGNNILASISEHFDSYAFYHADVWIKSMPTFIIAALTFIIIAYLAWRGGRTYCNTICPVGTVLSFFARFSLFKIYFDEDKCRKCSKCSKNCKASCIDYKNMTVDHSRCVTCGNCLEQCSFDALHFGIKRGKKQEVDEGKRAFLLGAALATTGAAIAQVKKKTDGGLAVIEDKEAPERKTPLTPPGSFSAKNMSQHCTACQLCVSECPNDVLRPSTDLLTMMQPTMSYERGYCRPECHRCSDVCPTGAIKPIKPEEKTSIQIGHAVWIKNQCIPVITDADKEQEAVECGNCARHCPTGAILMVPLREDDENAPLVPAVNTQKCIGCGACENLCPARPFPAIYVEGHEMHRII